MDRLTIKGVEAWIRIGCTPQERAFPQRVDLDVDLWLPLSRPGRTDALKDSIDYADVLARIKTEAERVEVKLLETVAERTASLVLNLYPVFKTTVRVRKKALSGIDHAEVEIERRSARRSRRKI